eukprot:SAG31_NODE_752_length_12351_cov_14.467516_4_plen_93_part_00
MCHPSILCGFCAAYSHGLPRSLAQMQMTNYLIRGALPSLVPLIAEPQGWSENQIAVLLSAFYPGYLLTQIPSGWYDQRAAAGSEICPGRSCG